MNKKKEKRVFLVILFAIIFSFVVQDSLRLVLQKIFEIPNESMGLALWGDTFVTRIAASLIGTASGTFIIGTYLKKRALTSAIFATIPTVIFWIATLALGLIWIYQQGSFSGSLKYFVVMPIILIVATPLTGYKCALWGREYHDDFQKPKSILNITWYHWLWILPIYLNKVIAVPLYTLLLLWQVDLLFDTSNGFPGIIDFISNWSYYLVRFIILLVLGGMVASISHAYSLLSKGDVITKAKWKRVLFVVGHVLLLSILFFGFFSNQY